MSSSSNKTKQLHCVRCHESFTPGSKANKPNSCLIEHDYDSFEGSRNGTQWYTGTLSCCGADYRFHRHSSDDRADPKQCFKGRHTADPSEVDYAASTEIVICQAEECGKEFHEATKKEYEKQMAAKKEREEAKKRKRQEEKAAKKRRMDELRSKGKRREARKLRAEMLGYDAESDELNSDVDPDGCEEFDYASDSSLVPPWLMDD